MSPVKAQAFVPERLRTATAANLMTPNPVSIRDSATVPELVAMLTERNISGAPVINEAGRPIGVVTQADILIHDRERDDPGAPSGSSHERGSTTATADATLVQGIMTPVVFSVGLKASAHTVVEELLRMNVHRLFVVDEDGALVGVISPLDVLRHMV
jgi:CBS domain-containing protein